MGAVPKLEGSGVRSLGSFGDERFERVQGLEFEGLAFRVQGLGFEGLAFRV